MKKLILTTIMSVAALGAFAQGTVTFLNDTVTLGTSQDRFIRFGSSGSPAGGLAFGTNIQVQLYYGASGSAESALIPLSAGPARLRVSTSSAIGTWTGGSRTFQSAAPGAGLTLQIRVWDINFGATYDAAAANPNNGGLIGKSGLFAYTVPQATDPASAFVMANWTSQTIGGVTGGVVIDVVPEPATFALAGLGAAALLIFRRRK